MNYVDDSTDEEPPGLEQHIQCMRDQGFDVPDPVRTDHGWEIEAGGSVNFSSPAWREAEFVTCALSKFVDRPLGGALALVGTADQIAVFVTCMQAQGFELPDPAQGTGGSYRFDIPSAIDTSSDAWNQALFVTCALPDPWPSGPPPSGPIGPSGGPSGPLGG